VGIGKIELLEAVAATGSLAQAARKMRMSYRRAWLLLEDLNGSFEQTVTQSSVGGKGGGGVTLTPFGLRLISAFRGLETLLQPQAAEQFREFTRQVRGGALKRTVKPLQRGSRRGDTVL
jgi:molybdate transport system regulatory protein